MNLARLKNNLYLLQQIKLLVFYKFVKMKFYDSENKIRALQRLDWQATVVEVKRNPEKYEHIKKHLRGYRVNHIDLSISDM